MQTSFTDLTGATINVIVNRNPLQNNYVAFVQIQDKWAMMGDGFNANEALHDAEVQWNLNLE